MAPNTTALMGKCCLTWAQKPGLLGMPGSSCHESSPPTSHQALNSPQRSRVLTPALFPAKREPGQLIRTRSEREVALKAAQFAQPQASRAADEHVTDPDKLFLRCHLPRSTGEDRHPPQQGLVFALLINLSNTARWLQRLFSLGLTAFSFKTRKFGAKLLPSVMHQYPQLGKA